jgi:formate hydrogenlyase subunit 6/NADH:ubiquinone oxidoreductase subunit I
MSYFANIRRGIKTTAKGMSLTLKHLWNARKTKGPINVQHPDYFKMADGHVTLQYPHETLLVPDHGRYQLDCEIDDCIVCDKCAKICPVDCIDIEVIKSPELIRYASDGSPVRLHAAKFDIDMAKCCFCGLCTTVCPTECLTMNSEYDYSVIDITQMNFAFANLTEEQAQEKRDLYDQFVAEKEAAKQSKPAAAPAETEKPAGFAPKFKPVMKPAEPKTESEEAPVAQEAKPAFTPKFKPKASPEVSQDAAEDTAEAAPKFVPKFQPKIKPSSPAAETITPESETPETTPKFVPKFQPKLKPTSSLTEVEVPKEPVAETTLEANEQPLSAAPKFVPKIKPKTAEPVENTAEAAPAPKFVPKIKPKTTEPVENTIAPEVPAAPKFVPKLKPSVKAEEAPATENKEEQPETEKPKAVFRPTLKPKK